MPNNFAVLGQRFLSGIESLTHEVAPDPGERQIDFIDSAEFFGTDYHLEWLVEGLLVQGQPAVIGGAKKTLKTSLLIDLVISIATGRRFLRYFSVPERRRTGLISGESGAATVQETARRVCQFKGIQDPSRLDVHWGFVLPRLSRDADLLALEQRVRDHGLGVVVLDPLYLCLLADSEGLEASNLYKMGPLLDDVTRACLGAGATPILAHHNKLGSSRSFEPPELEDLAYAGIQEFARQWLLVGRREKYEPGTGEHALWLNVGGSAGHSGCWAMDVSEGVLQADSRRHWRVRVRSATQERQMQNDRRRQERDKRQQDRDHEDRQRMQRALRRYPDGETLSTLRDSAGVGSRTRGILDEMVDAGQVERVEVVKPAGRSGTRAHPGYRLVLDVADPELDGEEVDDDGNGNIGDGEEGGIGDRDDLCRPQHPEPCNGRDGRDGRAGYGPSGP